MGRWEAVSVADGAERSHTNYHHQSVHTKLMETGVVGHTTSGEQRPVVAEPPEVVVTLGVVTQLRQCAVSFYPERAGQGS